MPILTTFLQRHRRALFISGGVLLLYSLLGFFLLPWVVEKQLAGTLQQRLQLNTQVERIYFNPFTFYAAIENLHIADANAAALLTLGKLHANFQASRLLLLKLQFAEIGIADLDVNFSRDSLTQNTLSILAQHWEQSAPADTEPQPDTNEAESEDEIVPLQILSLNLSNLQLHITDSVPATPFITSLRLASAQVNDFSTLPDEQGDNSLAINFEQGARLNWEGGFSINPLELNGNIALSDFNLAASSRYFQDILPFRLNDGLLDAGFNYDVSLAANAPTITLDSVALQVRSLEATEVNAQAAFFSVQGIGFQNAVLQIPENTLNIPAVTVNSLHIAATRDNNGVLNIQRMLDSFANNTAQANTGSSTAPDPEPPMPATTQAPWQIHVNELQVADNTLQFSDESLSTPFTDSARLNATVRNISNAQQARLPLDIRLNLESGGSFVVAGELEILPALDLSGTLTIDALALNAAQPYLHDFTAVRLQSGSLLSNIAFASNPDEPLSVSGNLEITDLSISDELADADLFSLPQLGVDQFNYSTAENRAEISEVTVTGAQARIVVYEDGTTNISRSMRAPSNTTDAAAPAQDNTDSATATSVSALPAISLARLTLNNAGAEYTDRNLPLVFNANIEQLNGAINDISNTTRVATNIDLEGQVGEFGLLQLSASLDPFAFTRQSQIDLTFTNIDLPSVTPYVIKFAGREIDDGDVDLDLQYTLDTGELTASNQMVLNDLQLGARVEQPGAMDLPLDLALALLKDSNGVIDLEIPVTGNVNDPEFDFGPAIRRAITTILTNIVAAPFRMLGSLIGGGDDTSLDHIRFLPGRADLAAPEQQVLLQLGEALLQRPQLVLELPLVNAGAADVAALQEALVDANIEARLTANVSTTTEQLSLTERRTQALEFLYRAAQLTTTLEQIRILHSVQSETDTATATPAATDSPATFDVLAYNADLRDRLITAAAIDQAELDALAQSRADNVLRFLLTNSTIDAARIRFTDPVEGQLDEDNWLTMNFDLSAE